MQKWKRIRAVTGFCRGFRYIAGMQLQLGAMVDELQGVREQLAKMQESQPKAVSSKLLEQVLHLQEKIGGIANVCQL